MAVPNEPICKNLAEHLEWCTPGGTQTRTCQKAAFQVPGGSRVTPGHGHAVTDDDEEHEHKKGDSTKNMAVRRGSRPGFMQNDVELWIVCWTQHSAVA